MSCVGKSVEDLGRAIHSLLERFSLAGEHRSEFDDALLDWVKGISVATEIVKAAERCGDEACREEATRTAAAYLDMDLPPDLTWPGVSLVRDVALKLSTDREYRARKVEIQHRLTENIEELLDVAHGLSDHDRALVEDYAIMLAESLSGLAEGEAGQDTDIPKFMKAYWAEWAAMLRGRTLPLATIRDDDAVAHALLRRFLNTSFLQPTASELPRHLSSSVDPTDLCAECAYETRCAVDSRSKPHVALRELPDCARTLVANNAGFLDSSEILAPYCPEHYFDVVIRNNLQQIDERLYEQALHATPGWAFSVLQRWNSYTPAMGASEGGGYFLYRVPKGPEDGTRGARIDAGIVIDPGYGFLRNFFGQGFGVRDVTGIIVTHDHPDHLVDFEPLVNLLLECRKDRSGTGRVVGANRKIDALLSMGAYERLRPVLETTPEVFRDTFRRDPARREDFAEPVSFRDANGRKLSTLSATASLALHKDASDVMTRHGHDGIGVVLKVSTPEGQTAQIAVPSDTEWSEELVHQYFETAEGSDVLCLHLGGIARKDFRVLDYFSEDKTSHVIIHSGWHLYLPGVLWFLSRASAAVKSGSHSCLVILSEFGEEMSHGIRVDLVERLNRFVLSEAKGGRPPVVVVPGDVGLLVDPIAKRIKCSCCGNYYSWDTPFAFEVFGESEQVFYVCAGCGQSLSSDERHTIFRQHQSPLARPVS